MQKQLTEKVDFDLIRYANCWEDVNILLKGLNAQPGSKILSIGSAGDNSFSLLTTDPELVVAIDVNKIQLYLIELKKICFELLSYHEMVSFLGFRDSQNRIETFQKIRQFLSSSASQYWQKNTKSIQKGIISQGKFEKYFQIFSHKILPLIHSKKTTKELLEPKSAQKQQKLYHNKWNTWRWKGLFRIFFSRYIMGNLGRDPEFLKQVKIPVSKYVFDKTEKQLKSKNAQDNYMLHYQLTGSFGNRLPHYLLPENFNKIKSNIHKLKIIEGYAEEGMKRFGKFHYMNLSNIFEYMDKNLFEKTTNTLIKSMEPNGTFAY